jgi:hypothetical protein
MVFAIGVNVATDLPEAGMTDDTRYCDIPRPAGDRQRQRNGDKQ